MDTLAIAFLALFRSKKGTFTTIYVTTCTVFVTILIVVNTNIRHTREEG